MPLPVEPPLEPMLAELREEIPLGDAWLYEPKWDGFRALVFRDGERMELLSRRGQALERYFPELLEELSHALPARAVIDGEIVIAGRAGLDFDALLQRIHPAASRIARLARETPSSFIAFDALALGRRDLRPLPFAERRRLLEGALATSARVILTPQTDDPQVAERWFDRFEGAGLDGLVAKRRDLEYRAAERVMVKVKHARTADCVVGGYREAKAGGVGSLLLGLYDGAGVLHYVGHTSAFTGAMRRELSRQLAALVGGDSFGEGRSPGGPSRWARGRETAWVPLRPELVCEVAFDHLQGDRFRHAARFLRWRPDKAPHQCTYDQIAAPRPVRLQEIVRLSRRRAAPPAAHP